MNLLPGLLDLQHGEGYRLGPALATKPTAYESYLAIQPGYVSLFVLYAIPRPCCACRPTSIVCNINAGYWWEDGPCMASLAMGRPRWSSPLPCVSLLDPGPDSLRRLSTASCASPSKSSISMSPSSSGADLPCRTFILSTGVHMRRREPASCALNLFERI